MSASLCAVEASGLQLRDYQRATIDAVLAPRAGVWRRLIVLATGAGKTICFARLLDEVLEAGESALVLAHREELLDQARAKLAMAAPTLSVELEQAESRAERRQTLFTAAGRRVVVGSVQTLRGRRLRSWSPESFRYLVVDEAHHATAPTYKDIFEHFGCLDPQRRVPLLGVTATARRSDKIGLGAIFQDIAHQVGMAELVKAGHLSRIHAFRLTSDVDLSDVAVVSGDFAAGELEEAVNVEARNQQIVAAYLRWGAGTKALVFCAGVAHAQAVADRFVEAGVASEAMWGAMEDEDRRAALGRFASGETRVLTNMNLLAEGYDEPSIGTIILARPTRSSLILTQQVGRGTRIAEGKSHVVVIDVRDVTVATKLESVATLAGLPPNWKEAQGEDVFAAAEALAAVPDELRDVTQSMDDVHRVSARLAALKEAYRQSSQRLAARLEAERIDLLAAVEVDPIVAENSQNAWHSPSPQHYRLAMVDVSYEIACDALGTWRVTRVALRDGAKVSSEVGTAVNTFAAFRLADSHVKREGQGRLVDRSAAWRDQPASEKQLSALRWKLRELPAGLTKGQASALLARVFREKAS